jgi:formate hydrogenlyase transcriptional activator
MTTVLDEFAAPPTETGWNEMPFDPKARTLENPEAQAPALDQGLPQLLYELAVRLPAQPEIHALCVWLYEPVRQAVRLHVLLGGLKAGMDFPAADSIANWVWKHQRPLTIDTKTETRFREFAETLLESGVKSFCGVPLMIGDRRIGVLGLASTLSEAFRDFQLQFMQRSSPNGSPGVRLPAIGASINNDGGNEEMFDLEKKVRAQDKFEGIVGHSDSLRAVLNQVQIVAPTDSTVLILGETGTGKELVARAIHNRSSRRDKPFVRVNCAAIPSGLIESELFGHERGAFTGALTRKIGRFEMADGGTLFLDEIGDLPFDLQPKLLRVLQEQEFERLGSTVTTRVNVRVVAATSRNLPEMVANREFRSDLYYRLNVFPVQLPALRERPADIPLLVRHFVNLCATRMNKCVEEIPSQAMEILRGYHWPGNVRELQNFIERAVILSPGKVLQAPLAELKQPCDRRDASPQNATENVTLKDAEREHIIQALAETNWVIGGPKGAAARLGLVRTTLISKMQRLSISRAQA